MSYTKLISGRFLGIINEERMVEVKAKDKDDAKTILEKAFPKCSISICKIPTIVGYID